MITSSSWSYRLLPWIVGPFEWQTHRHQTRKMRLTEGYVWMDWCMHVDNYLSIYPSRNLDMRSHHGSSSASSNPQARRSSPAWSLTGKTKMSDSDMGPLAKDKVCKVRKKHQKHFVRFNKIGWLMMIPATLMSTITISVYIRCILTYAQIVVFTATVACGCFP